MSLFWGLPHALAETNLSAFLELYDDGNRETQDYFERIVGATENGMAWANVESKDLLGGPLYCPPGKLALTGAQVIDIMRRAGKDHPTLRDLPYGLVMMMAMRMVFPCPGAPAPYAK